MQRIFVDGSIGKNKASIGIYGLENSKETILFSDYINATNSTEAELSAILAALTLFIIPQEKTQIFCDSKDVVTLITSKHYKKTDNSIIDDLICEIHNNCTANIRIFYIKRKNNKIAHKLAYTATTKGLVFNNTIEENIASFYHHFPNINKNSIKKNKKEKKKITVINTLNDLLQITAMQQNTIIELKKQVQQL